jgi:hypothetical protein
MPTDVVGSRLPWVEAIARSFEQQPFVEFHRVRLPALNARNGRLVTSDLRGVASLAFRAGDEAFTWIGSDDGVRVVEGDAGAATWSRSPRRPSRSSSTSCSPHRAP